MEQKTWDTPIGRILLSCRDDHLLGISLPPISIEKNQTSPLLEQCQQQLSDYFAGRRKQFSLPIKLLGTDHQQRVWQKIAEIPYGETLCYGDIALQTGSSPRAVGNACRNNPIPLIIPCHRVVAKNGIGGFSGRCEGEEISVKRWLLGHEGVIC